MKSLIGFMLLICYTQSNVWDNIFSKMHAQSPIILKQSISFAFPLKYQEYQLTGHFDFNQNLNILTIIVSKYAILFDIKLFIFQLDLQNYIANVQQIFKQCSRYSLKGIQELHLKPFSLQKYEDKIFLMNLLFQWIGKTSQKSIMYDQYQLKPNLLGVQDDMVSEYKLQISPILEVDPTGSIAKIYENPKRDKQIPFNNKSLVKQKATCQSQITYIEKDDIQQLIEQLFESRGIDVDQIQNLNIDDIFRN